MRSVFDVAQVRLFSVIIAEFNETVRSTDFISACHADPVLPTYLFRIIEVCCLSFGTFVSRTSPNELRVPNGLMAFDTHR